MSKMSALNMAMNGNAYKMIEIKKVSGPVVPLSSLNPLSTLTDRYEPLPSGPSQQPRTFTDLNSLNHNPAYNLGPGLGSGHIQANGSISSYSPMSQQSNGTITTYAPLSQSNGPATLQRAGPPPPPSREGTLARKADTLGGRVGPGGPGAQVEGLLATRQVTGVETGGLGTTSPPARQHEETNGVAVVSQQEQDLYTKEDEKWWWVCCLEFCFCLL